jgi:hypothetical protein
LNVTRGSNNRPTVRVDLHDQGRGWRFLIGTDPKHTSEMGISPMPGEQVLTLEQARSAALREVQQWWPRNYDVNWDGSEPDWIGRFRPVD